MIIHQIITVLLNNNLYTHVENIYKFIDIITTTEKKVAVTVQFAIYTMKINNLFNIHLLFKNTTDLQPNTP